MFPFDMKTSWRFEVSPGKVGVIAVIIYWILMRCQVNLSVAHIASSFQLPAMKLQTKLQGIRRNTFAQKCNAKSSVSSSPGSKPVQGPSKGYSRRVQLWSSFSMLGIDC